MSPRNRAIAVGAFVGFLVVEVVLVVVILATDIGFAPVAALPAAGAIGGGGLGLERYQRSHPQD